MGILTRAAVAVDAFALDAVKTYLRIDGESEDSALSALIATAVEQCEAFIGVAVVAGSRVEITQGCDKRFATCVARFSNAVNFRGEPHLPGNDLLTRYGE